MRVLVSGGVWFGKREKPYGETAVLECAEVVSFVESGSSLSLQPSKEQG